MDSRTKGKHNVLKNSPSNSRGKWIVRKINGGKKGDVKENSIFSQLKKIQFDSNFLKYM